MKKITHVTVPLNHPVEIHINRPVILGWKPVHKADKSPFMTDVQKQLQRLIDRDGNKCTYCLKEVYHPSQGLLPIATRDHFVPRSLGGSNDISNLVIACQACNQAKADMMPYDFMRKIWGENLENCPHEIKVPGE